MIDVSDSGVLTTASDLVITGGREGYLQILDARTGELLWRRNLGAQISNGPMTYRWTASSTSPLSRGLSMVTFGLRDGE